VPGRDKRRAIEMGIETGHPDGEVLGDRGYDDIVAIEAVVQGFRHVRREPECGYDRAPLVVELVVARTDAIEGHPLVLDCFWAIPPVTAVDGYLVAVRGEPAADLVNALLGPSLTERINLAGDESDIHRMIPT